MPRTDKKKLLENGFLTITELVKITCFTRGYVQSWVDDGMIEFTTPNKESKCKLLHADSVENYMDSQNLPVHEKIREAARRYRRIYGGGMLQQSDGELSQSPQSQQSQQRNTTDNIPL